MTLALPPESRDSASNQKAEVKFHCPHLHFAFIRSLLTLPPPQTLAVRETHYTTRFKQKYKLYFILIYETKQTDNNSCLSATAIKISKLENAETFTFSIAVKPHTNKPHSFNMLHTKGYLGMTLAKGSMLSSG